MGWKVGNGQTLVHPVQQRRAPLGRLGNSHIRSIVHSMLYQARVNLTQVRQQVCSMGVTSL